MYTNISILGVVQALETFIPDEVERELIINLVGALYEFSGSTFQVRNDPNVLWYRRYLDDISIG